MLSNANILGLNPICPQIKFYKANGLITRKSFEKAKNKYVSDGAGQQWGFLTHKSPSSTLLSLKKFNLDLKDTFALIGFKYHYCFIHFFYSSCFFFYFLVQFKYSF